MTLKQAKAHIKTELTISITHIVNNVGQQSAMCIKMTKSPYLQT